MTKHSNSPLSPAYGKEVTDPLGLLPLLLVFWYSLLGVADLSVAGASCLIPAAVSRSVGDVLNCFTNHYH